MTLKQILKRAWRRAVASLFRNFPAAWGARDAIDGIDWSKSAVRQRVYGRAREGNS